MNKREMDILLEKLEKLFSKYKYTCQDVTYEIIEKELGISHNEAIELTNEYMEREYCKNEINEMIWGVD